MPMIPLGLKETKDIDFRDPFKVSRANPIERFSRSSSFRIMTTTCPDTMEMSRDIIPVHSSGGTSGLSSKSPRSFLSSVATFLCPRFAEAVLSVALRMSRMSEGGPISRKARREVAGGFTLTTFVSRSRLLPLVDSGFLTISDGIIRAIEISKLPVIVFRRTLLRPTDTSQGRVSCKIFPFTVTRT